MHTKRAALLLLLIFVIASCAPAVPWDQMPGSDLYSSAQGSRMTADALMRQAAWQEQALTATAQAPIVRITETAAAITVQAAQAQSTSIAGAATQAPAPSHTAPPPWLQAVPAGRLGCVGTPAAQASLVHWLPSSAGTSAL